ncbi:MAG TPA: phosphoglucosamine mutase, partial [Verrucomicrobiae bacterium]|nr:phosphoglucosamine mutase [Verrucomicrobiae bacterium]
MSRLFGTDGIRGLANAEPLTTELAFRLGRQLAATLVEHHGVAKVRLVVGRDTRQSGPMLEGALVSGAMSAGADVFAVGVLPTPGIAYLTRYLEAHGGVVISASHNPYEDNGIKLFDPDGYKLSDEAEGQIESLMGAPSADMLAPADRIGRAKRIESAQERYIEYAKRTLPRNIRLNDLRVVVDCANGAGYQVAPDALWELGAEVIKIGVEPNGHNINLKCGSTSPEALCEKVREMRADIGVALDGDADRVVIVDEKGRIVDGDQIMAVIAESWHGSGKLTAGGVVATVMSNLGLERYLGGMGLEMVRTPVGDRYVTEHMRKHGYNVGGEQSGHIVLSDFTTTGDGLVTALQVLSVVVGTGKPVSEVCKRFERLPQILQNVPYANGKPLEQDLVKKAIDQGKA